MSTDRLMTPSVLFQKGWRAWSCGHRRSTANEEDQREGNDEGQGTVVFEFPPRNEKIRNNEHFSLQIVIETDDASAFPFKDIYETNQVDIVSRKVFVLIVGKRERRIGLQ